MSRCGDVYENRVTGEWAVVLRGTDDRGDGPGIAHLTARPGAAVVGEHFHPHLIERFSVVRGRLSARIGGQSLSLGPGQSVTIEPGVAHDWWNASDSEDAHVLAEVDRVPGYEAVDANRFEALIGMLLGLANAIHSVLPEFGHYFSSAINAADEDLIRCEDLSMTIPVI